MKILRITILLALVVSFLPLDAFCEDRHDEAEHHHGIVMCHASCHGAILTSDTTIKIKDTLTYIIPSSGFIYEAPILPAEFRPPIIVS